MALIDLKGQKFRKLTVVKRELPNTPGGKARWRCRCECGGEIVGAYRSKKGLQNSESRL